MASSTASKITPQPKAAVKPADIKVAVAKAPVAKPAAPVKAPNVKVATVPVAQLAAARAPESRPASTRAMPAAVGAATAQRISAPAAPAPVAAAPAAAAVVTPKDIALKAQQAAAATPKKPINARHGFKINELVVYPAHGVGRIVGIEEQEIAGMALELFVITFEKDKMTLRVPTGRSQSVMRKLAEDGVVKRAMETLKGKARIKRTMWSRRAQEFEQKINSGDLVSIAEVVRDLFRAETQPEQSYSERQLYEAALDRMAREIAAVEKIDERGAVQRVTEVLSKSAKSRRAESEAAAPAGDIKAA
jgi:CarD family transcriptional regulator